MDKQLHVEHLHDARPYEHRLSNARLTTTVTRAGAGGIRYGALALTRRIPDPTRDADGYFLYVRDLDDGAVWSAGHQPVQRPPDRYATRFEPGRAVFERFDRGIETRLDVCVAPDAAVDLRRITLTNRSERPRRLEVTSYAEVVLNAPAADAAHPAFSKLFVQTEWLPEPGALLARRRPRSPEDPSAWLFHTVAANDAAAPLPAYETDRARFIGRGRSPARPRALTAGAALSGTVGNVLDPIVSLRCVVRLAPGAQAQRTFVLGAAPDRDEAERLARRFRSPDTVHHAFAQARTGDEDRDDTPVVVWTPAASRPDERFQPVGPAETPVPPSTRETLPAHETLRFDNGYGGFAEDGAAYVIRLGDEETPPANAPPLPWANVVANERLGFLVTESGAGYTWSINSRENRLTAWHNDPVTDPTGEALYLRDEDAGVFWSPTPGPAPDTGAYEVRHGFGYTLFRHRSYGLDQEVAQFVAPTDSVKITRVRLTNRGDRPRRLTVFAYYRLVLGGLPLARGATVVTDYDPETGAILARNPANAPFEARVAFCAATACLPGATARHTADRTAFLGPCGDLSNPHALRRDAPLDGRTGAGLDPCAAFEMPLVLDPGATRTCLVVLGQGADAAEARTLAARYRDEAAVEAAFDDARAYWTRILSTVRIETPAPDIDLMVNGWLAYQTLSCRLWARSAYYQPGGAYGFRDQLQDAAALVYLAPGLTRAQILRHAAHQFAEGDVLHWWHPPHDAGLRTRFSDDLLWLPYVTAFYLQTTGDASILDDDAPFLRARALQPGEDEAFLVPEDAGETAPVYEHCCRALDRSLTAGPHGLPLIGSGDWNDGMNRVGREGCGESVWLGFFLYAILDAFIPLCARRGDDPRVARYTAYRARLADALNEAGWDGAWYRRAYYDDGTPLGSADNDECRIDAIAQAWAVLSGVAPADRARQALDALEKHLVSEEEGLIRLLTPPFDRTPRDPGYIKGYVPGVRENGGQYTHGALWAVQALAHAGRGNRAGALLSMLTPVRRGGSADAVAVYKVEPYVVAADVYGVPPHVGRGGWTWYTGSAGWMYRVALESLLGLRLEENRRFSLKPGIPDTWPAYRITYRVDEAGTTYEIQVRNPDGCARRVTAATLDGAPLPVRDGAALIPITRDGRVHRVAVRLGP